MVVLYAETVPSIGFASTEPDVMTSDKSGSGGPGVPNIFEGELGIGVFLFWGDETKS